MHILSIVFWLLKVSACIVFLVSQVNCTDSAVATKVAASKKKLSSPPRLQRYQPVVDAVFTFPKVKRATKTSSAAMPAKRMVTTVSTPRSIQPILEPPSRQKRAAKTALDKQTPAKLRKVQFNIISSFESQKIKQYFIYFFILALETIQGGQR